MINIELLYGEKYSLILLCERETLKIPQVRHTGTASFISLSANAIIVHTKVSRPGLIFYSVSKITSSGIYFAKSSLF